MRAVVRCVLAVIVIAASVMVGPAGVSPAAVNQSSGLAIASVLPARGAVVGVAHPVVVTFRAPVVNRHAAERAISVTSAPSMTGKFEWPDDNVVRWVPDRFWPAHRTVALSVGGLSTEFETGPAVVGVANISDHTFRVSIDGVEAGPPPSLPAPHHRPHWGEQGVMPASMGRPEYETPVGSYTVLSKDRTVIMDSSSVGIPVDDPDGYRITGGLRRPHHQPGPVRAFSPVGPEFTGARECQPRLHQPEPRGRRVVLQHGQHRRPRDSAGITAATARRLRDSARTGWKRLTGHWPAGWCRTTRRVLDPGHVDKGSAGRSVQRTIKRNQRGTHRHHRKRRTSRGTRRNRKTRGQRRTGRHRKTRRHRRTGRHWRPKRNQRRAGRHRNRPGRNQRNTRHLGDGRASQACAAGRRCRSAPGSRSAGRRQSAGRCRSTGRRQSAGSSRSAGRRQCVRAGQRRSLARHPLDARIAAGFQWGGCGVRTQRHSGPAQSSDGTHFDVEPIKDRHRRRLL